jgi:hypothetical protein
MALNALETLVLHGVTVVVDGVAVNVRLGFGVEAGANFGSIANPKRHPSPSHRPDYRQPADGQDPRIADPVEMSRVGGAGRSHGNGARCGRHSALSRSKAMRRMFSTFPTRPCAARGKRLEDTLAWLTPATRTPPTTTTRGTRSR